MNRMTLVAVLLMALINGCATSDDFSLPPGVLGYTDIAASSLNEAFPQVAFDGTNYLVVYETAVTDSNHDVWAALVSSGGTVITSVAIDTSTNDDRVPKVAFDGTNFLVVFQRTTPFPTMNQYIFGAFVSTAGMVLPGSPFPIDNSTNTNGSPAVAFNLNQGVGTYLVVYQKAVGSTNHDIIGTVLDTAGSVVAGPSIIDNSLSDDTSPEAASNPGQSFFLVVYQRTVSLTNHDIIGAFLDAGSGGVVGSPFNIDASANDDSAPAVATAGGSYLVAYQRTIISTNNDIIGAVVDFPGTVGTPFAIDDSSNDDLAPAVASDTTNYLAVYQRAAGTTNHNIMGKRVDPAGTVLGTVAIDTTGFDDLLPALAFGNGNYLVAYEEATSSTNHDIFGALVAQ